MPATVGLRINNKVISSRMKLLLSVGVALVLIAAIFHFRAKWYYGAACAGWADQSSLKHQMEQFEKTGYPHGVYPPGYMVLTLGLERVTGIRDHCRAMSLLNGVLFAISILATLAIGLRMGASTLLLIAGMIVLVFGSNALFFNWAPWTHWVPIGLISVYVLAITYVVDSRSSKRANLIASTTIGFLTLFLLWSRTIEAVIILFALIVSYGCYLFMFRPAKRRCTEQVAGFIVGVVLCAGLTAGTLGKVIPERQYGNLKIFENSISIWTPDFRVLHHKFIQVFIHSGHYNLWDWTPFSVGNLLRPPIYPRRVGDMNIMLTSFIQPITNQVPLIFLYVALGVYFGIKAIRNVFHKAYTVYPVRLRLHQEVAVKAIPGIFSFMVGPLIVVAYLANPTVGSTALKYIFARDFIIFVPLTVALTYILQPTWKEWGVIFCIGLGLVLMTSLSSILLVNDIRGVSPRATIVCMDETANSNYVCQFRYAFTRDGKEIPALPGKTYFKISVRNKGLPQSLTQSLLKCEKTKYEELCHFELPRNSPPRKNLIMLPGFSVLGNIAVPEAEESYISVPIRYVSTK